MVIFQYKIKQLLLLVVSKILHKFINFKNSWQGYTRSHSKSYKWKRMQNIKVNFALNIRQTIFILSTWWNQKQVSRWLTHIEMIYTQLQKASDAVASDIHLIHEGYGKQERGQLGVGLSVSHLEQNRFHFLVWTMVFPISLTHGLCRMLNKKARITVPYPKRLKLFPRDLCCYLVFSYFLK